MICLYVVFNVIYLIFLSTTFARIRPLCSRWSLVTTLFHHVIVLHQVHANFEPILPFPDLTPIWPVLNLSQKYISLLKVGFIVTKLCPLVLVHLCRVEHVWMLAGNILTSFLYCLSHYLFNWAQLGPFAFAVTISSVTKFLHGHRSTFYRLKTTQFLQAIKVNYCTISQWALDYHDLDQQHSPHLCDDNQTWH